ncbi:MAG TPA: hypothetical protein DCY13_05925 [Verrucomicrobiales bacterium]|nr:hypothetical protein [Verrucomicrobiales bacterium]
MERKRSQLTALFLALTAGGVFPAFAQIDPDKRQLIQLGFNHHLVGEAPLNAYGFYYFNQPGFWRTNLTLRLAIAPVYLDGELGIREALGRNTDVGINFAGGGFAESYFEFRRGSWIEEESFTSHGGGAGLSLYHRFNPQQQIPLSLVLRATPEYSTYDDDDETDPAFELPRNQWSHRFRGGVRWGGREPLLAPRLAMEVSGWYETDLRMEPGAYGFNDDRRLEEWTHRLWGRALLIYTIPEWEHQFEASVSGGTSWETDRFSAFRLGGMLPLAEEFALLLPGYFFQEISAERYFHFLAAYRMPLGQRNRWHWKTTFAGAGVDPLPGVTMGETFLTGIGSGITYLDNSGSWQATVAYAYGFQAIRPDGFRGHSLSFLLQFDLGRYRDPDAQPTVNPYSSRGLLKFFRR